MGTAKPHMHGVKTIIPVSLFSHGRDCYHEEIMDQSVLVLKLKDALLDDYDPEAVILFGSLARGDADEFSDVDLLVVIETERNVKEFGEEMTRHLDPLTTEKHIIVKTPHDFRHQKDIPGTIVFSAATEGRVLFDKKTWRKSNLPSDSYQKRKEEVLCRDYIRSSHDFLSEAESSLQTGNLFRSRDMARFAAVRAIKSVFVRHDIHPPRETDLLQLLQKSVELEPDMAVKEPFLRELNSYSPDGSGPSERQRGRDMLDGTTGVVKEIVGEKPREEAC